MALTPINPSGVSTAFIYPRDTAGGPGIDFFIDADPGETNAPIIFEPGCELTGSRLVVWIVASGASPNWGGAEIWTSVEPDANYGLIGTISRNVQGVLSADFPFGFDPDTGIPTGNVLSVDLTESLTMLTAGTTLDADKHITLCYCDGELIAYSAATLTSAYHYDLDTYIRRGVYGTAVETHPAGSAFARLTPAVFQQEYPADLIGTTVYFKFPAFNTLGQREQALADVPYYAYTLIGRGISNLNVTTVTQGSTEILTATAGCSLDNLVEVISGTLANTTINGPVSGVTPGLRYILKDMNNNAGSYAISFVPHSGETVDGEPSYDMTFSGGSAEIIWDGAAWVVT